MMTPRLKLTLALYVAMFAAAWGRCALPGNPPLPSASVPPPNTNRYYLSICLPAVRPLLFIDGSNCWQVETGPTTNLLGKLIVDRPTNALTADFMDLSTNVVLRSSNHSYGKSYPLKVVFSTFDTATQKERWVTNWTGVWPNDWIPPFTNFLEVLASGALFVCATSVLGTRTFTTNRHFALDQSRDYGFATTNGSAPKVTTTNNRPNLAVFMHRQ